MCTLEFSSEMFYINVYLDHLVYIRLQGSKVFSAYEMFVFVVSLANIQLQYTF
jgi:hypothetical protein